MGGDSSFVWISSSDDNSSVGAENIESSVSSDDDECLIPKLESGSVINRDFGLRFGEITEDLMSKAAESQKNKMYIDVLKSYEKVICRTERLDEAKRMVLSYTPGSWVEKAGGMDSDEYDVPQSTSLLLIGPKASGKSSLVNKISQVLEDDVFTSARAQVSHSQISEDGTYFVHQYMIPRRLGSFCLFDTRGLSDDTNENLKVVKSWMRKGIRHGELVIRKSDSTDLKAQLKCKKHGVESSSQRRVINFVVFVVDGLSVLEAMNGGNDIKNEYCQSMSTIFNNPLLSFKDDKPVLVVTHGDLLSLSDRVNIRVYLGELLRIPPTTQIFDIPETDDPATELTTLDMLIYCLERADRNLSVKKQHADKRLPVQNRHAGMKLSVHKRHPEKLPVKKKLADKKFPVDNGFVDTMTSSIILWEFCFISSFLVAIVLCLFYSFQYSYIPAPTKYSVQTSHPYAPTSQAKENGTQSSCSRVTNNKTHGNSVHSNHPHAPANQSKEHGSQDIRHTDAPTNESHENRSKDSFSHTPAHASLRSDVQAHRPTDKARKNVDNAHHSHASRRNDAKAYYSHKSTHKSEARVVKDSQKYQALTEKVGKGIQVEWHKIRHIWSE